MRSYGQFCPIARGSEIFAERWTPIILRNLLLGCRRFDFQNRGRRTVWLLVERGGAEICRFDPGFGDDVTVGIDDPIAFARWHLGSIAWADAVRSGAITIEGPRDLRRALPTWNGAPEAHASGHRDRVDAGPSLSP